MNPVGEADLRGSGRRTSMWEYRELSFSRGTTTQEARAALTEAAEYGHWELARVRIFRNGGRRVWLRRKTYAVTRTA